MSVYFEEPPISIDEANRIEKYASERCGQYKPGVGHRRTKGFCRGLIPWHSDIVYTNGVEDVDTPLVP